MSDYTPSMHYFRQKYANRFSDEADVIEAEERFDAALAAHDAEVRASVVTEEPEWEYGEQSQFNPNTVWVIDPINQSMIWGDIPKEKRVRRRKAGPWEAIPDA